VSENYAETDPSYSLAPTRKGHRPLLMGNGTASGDARCQKLGRSRGNQR
jgi:hypothetical protein